MERGAKYTPPPSSFSAWSARTAARMWRGRTSASTRSFRYGMAWLMRTSSSLMEAMPRARRSFSQCWV
ncbi:hypothetical protein [Myxococcus sp. AB036A]|uniref:hypothetical protein n=1 Tax=Myxococcus sp. AB036A TaxID=2562793 RepID=UPI00114739A3|nr:hypothetical protein [Myxococcus sp. AB036A]